MQVQHAAVTTAASLGVGDAFEKVLNWGLTSLHVNMPADVQDAAVVLIAAGVGLALHSGLAAPLANLIGAAAQPLPSAASPAAPAATLDPTKG
jgi:hypothetical protein